MMDLLCSGGTFPQLFRRRDGMMELLAPKGPQDKRKGFYVLLNQNAGGGPASGSISTTYTTPPTWDTGLWKSGIWKSENLR